MLLYTDKQEILNRWTESTAQILTTMSLLGCQRYLTAHRYQVKSIALFYEKMWKQQSKALKMEKSVRVDNIQADLVQAGRDAIIDVLTLICNKIRKTGKWSTKRTQSLVMTLPKKDNLRL